MALPYFFFTNIIRHLGINLFFHQNIMKDKRHRVTTTILKKNKVGGLALPDFEIYSQVIVIRTVW
jgi:hypothetical protein